MESIDHAHQKVKDFLPFLILCELPHQKCSKEYFLKQEAQNKGVTEKSKRKRFIYPIRKFLFLDESGHEPQLRAVHADGATAKEAKMGGEARPSGSELGLMHRLRRNSG